MRPRGPTHAPTTAAKGEPHRGPLQKRCKCHFESDLRGRHVKLNGRKIALPSWRRPFRERNPGYTRFDDVVLLRPLARVLGVV